MSHLVAYEEAATEKDKALAAIEVVAHKNSKRLAWYWAGLAIEHAEAAGILDASDLVANTRWPDCSELEAALARL